MKNSKELKAYRHGDLALIEVKKLPEGMEKLDSKVLMTGSHGHDHVFDVGEFYPCINGIVIGYFVATENTKLYHPDHGKVVKGKTLREVVITAGVYELRKQQEDTNEGMRPVED
jgi:hypothetical protein